MNGMIMFVKNRPLVDPMLGPLFYHVDSLTGEALVYNKGELGFRELRTGYSSNSRLPKRIALPASQENPPVTRFLREVTGNDNYRHLGPSGTNETGQIESILDSVTIDR